MIDRELLQHRGVRGALLLCAVSSAVVLWSLWSALRPSSVSEAPVATFDTSGVARAPRGSVAIDLNAAVSRDLFAPDRTAPATPYRLPGEPSEAVSRAPIEAPVVPAVLGTAVLDGARSFATCQLAGSAPVIVHLGDHIGSVTVRAIERGHVRFASATGDVIDIPATKSGAP